LLDAMTYLLCTGIQDVVIFCDLPTSKVNQNVSLTQFWTKGGSLHLLATN
jgi:hypothetical protein